MTAEFDVVGFFDELMCALGEIAGSSAWSTMGASPLYG